MIRRLPHPEPSKRERSRSRFRVAILLAGFGLGAGCTNHFGFGLTGLAAEAGWQPLPIQAWVLNEGIAPHAIVFCPRETCAHEGVAAQISLSGKLADDLERALAADPATLAREFARPSGPARRSGAPKSLTRVERLADGPIPGLLVDIQARDAGARQAWTAILYRRAGDRLDLAIAVGREAETARAAARSAMASRW